jgi:hypothetical protein
MSEHTPENESPPPRKRGRPLGSRNKPKPPLSYNERLALSRRRTKEAEHEEFREFMAWIQWRGQKLTHADLATVFSANSYTGEPAHLSEPIQTETGAKWVSTPLSEEEAIVVKARLEAESQARDEELDRIWAGMSKEEKMQWEPKPEPQAGLSARRSWPPFKRR